MLFSSPIFIFVFLPGVLFGYYVLCFKKRKWQNRFLTVCSLFFYAWGEPWFVLVMLGSIIINWAMALWAERFRKQRKIFIALTVIINLSLLLVFKYLGFIIENINNLSKSISTSRIPVPQIILPLGISFFTFQALSYTLDVCRGRNAARKKLMDVALYISFFPQLIAGPIVRYETIADQIDNRKETMADFSAGICRFVVGLAKKVILANNLALVADAAFAADERSVALAWLGALAYTFQIYFDFSGYSDMAIGLGKMFGFHFLENFNYPYIARSVTEFWRRWHISLGTWFRDYIYFPLGGSRVKRGRLILNLLAVWLLTGIWHGANWTFIVWGLMYFVLIAFEKLSGVVKKTAPSKVASLLGFCYTFFFVVVGWAIFKADSMAAALGYLGSMFTVNAAGLYDNTALRWLMENRYFYLLAVVFSLPVARRMGGGVFGKSKVMQAAYPLLMAIVFLVTISYVVKGAYDPFIYFNF